MYFLRKVLMSGVFAAAGGYLLIAGCTDTSDLITVNPLLAKPCPPGQAKKGKCVQPPEPPTGTVEPSLPGFPPEEGMVSPLRMAVTPSGRLLVTDANLRMLLGVDPVSLVVDQALKLQGDPSGVGLSSDRIFVGNKTHGRVDVYAAADGDFLFSFGADVLENPSDLSVDPEVGLVFVSDLRIGQVLVFDLEGGFLNAISNRGILPEQLFAPMGIGLDPAAGEVFVSDWGDFGDGTVEASASVKIFSYQGAHLATISGEGDGCDWFTGVCTGGFSRPMGIAATPGGRVVFADLLLAQVLVYDRSSLSRVTTVGDRPQLRLPADVAVANGGDLFAVSNGTGTVESFPGGVQ